MRRSLASQPRALLTAGLLAVTATACSKGDGETPTPRAIGETSAKSSSAPAPPPKAKVARPYNVLLVLIDSMRADMPWNGYERDIAPRLTELSKRCVSYPKAYSISSYTAKSVGGLLIGRYPSEMKRDGMFFERWHDEHNVFVSELLKEKGHRSVAGHVHGYFLPSIGNNQGFDDWRLLPGGIDMRQVSAVTSDKLTDLAIDILDKPENTVQAEGKRFFAYFHYMDPHHTYEFHEGHPRFGSSDRDVYDNEIHYTDHWVGKLLDHVASKPYAEDTAIIISADHGESFGEHGHKRHSRELWESVTHVPMLVCIPKVPPKTIETRRSHIDLAPTILDLMGVQVPKDMRGHSLVPEIFGHAEAKPRLVVTDLPRDNLQDRRRAFITEDGYKLIVFGDAQKFEMYNLDENPEEDDELSEDEPEKLAELKKLYWKIEKRIPTIPVTGQHRLKGAPGWRRW